MKIGRRLRTARGEDRFFAAEGAIISELRSVAFAVTGAGEVIVEDGWLYCNGAAISRTKYKRLFDLLGTSYGAGDGSTTFNLPDYRGRSMSFATDGATGNRILGAGRGSTGGVTSVVISQAQMPTHVHGAGSFAISGGSHDHSSNFNTGGHVAGGSDGGDTTTRFAYNPQPSGSTASATHSHSTGDISGNTGSAGSDSSHTNIPPLQAAGAVLIRV